MAEETERQLFSNFQHSLWPPAVGFLCWSFCNLSASLCAWRLHPNTRNQPKGMLEVLCVDHGFYRIDKFSLFDKLTLALRSQLIIENLSGKNLMVDTQSMGSAGHCFQSSIFLSTVHLIFHRLTDMLGSSDHWLCGEVGKTITRFINWFFLLPNSLSPYSLQQTLRD